jgi:hypothetical protein
MHRVLDTIQHTNSWIHRYPELHKRGEGLLVILDPNDTANAFEEAARQATVLVSGRAPKVFAIDAVEKNKAGVIGLFFRGVQEADIPRGATITMS